MWTQEYPISINLIIGVAPLFMEFKLAMNINNKKGYNNKHNSSLMRIS
jgi:hypothetical protein